MGWLFSPTRRRGGLVDEVVDALCELDIEIGDAADVVGGELEGDFHVLDADVWVVLGFLGDFPDGADKVDGVHEFFKFEDAGDVFFFDFPLGAFFEGGE